MNLSKIFFSSISSLLVIFTFNACEKKETNLTVHWDRDMCSRCVMVVSDRQNTVQVIYKKSHKKYVFDDIGCMVKWFKEENATFKDTASIWVTDVKSGEWIDAKIAFYDAGNVTPMGFGFSAHKIKADIKDGKNILSYNEVIKRILTMKRKMNKKMPMH